MTSSPSYHALFGAGRLGLGLVLPALRSLGAPVVVFQRVAEDPSQSGWDKVITDDWVDVYANSTHVVRLRCLLDKDLNDGITEEELDQLLQSRTSLLVNCHSRSGRLEKAIMSRVCNCTAVVQPQDLPSIGQCLQTMCPTLQGKLFVVANDSKAVLSFSNQMRGVASGVEVVPVSGDRICFSRTLDKGRIHIECEQWNGSMGFFLDQSCMQDAFPFTPHRIAKRENKSVEISAARVPIEQQFYEERKTSLLNGAHFVMALLSYDLLRSRGVDRSKWPTMPLLEWQGSSVNAEDIDTFITLHIHRLAAQYEKDPQCLRDYANVVMKRILCTPDTLGRVLNLNDPSRVQAKYERYVKPLKSFCYQQLDKPQDSSNLNDAGMTWWHTGLDVLDRLKHKFDLCLSNNNKYNTIPQGAAPTAAQAM
jgi:hypothetical protein